MTTVSDRTPTARDIRLALLAAGFTESEATSALDKIKRRGIGIGHEMARETTQASVAVAFRKAQAIAWEEGHSWGWSDAQDAHDVRQIMGRADWPQRTPNPYREEAGL